MTTKQVLVTMTVEVTVDETRFTGDFMREFRESFYPFMTLDAHIKHIGQLAARELLREHFTEGYGPLVDFGIEARVVDQETEIL